MWVTGQTGLPDGEGVIYYYNGNKFEGTWKDGWKIFGTFTIDKNSKWAGNKYTGEWKNDLMHGKGTYIFSNGNKYVGNWFGWQNAWHGRNDFFQRREI